MSTDATETERIVATGHENVVAEHASTLEVTTDDYLTPAGDCIVGVEADRAAADLDREFVAACQSADARVELTLSAGEHEQRVVGRGDPELTFENDRSVVVRTSDYVDDRTVLVEADRAAADLDRDLVAALADGADLEVRLAVTPDGAVE